MYFKEKPMYVITTEKESKKIYTCDSTVLNEKRKWFNIPSYNCFILTRDEKLILCRRKYSYYASYIFYQLTRKKSVDTKKILKCLKHLYPKEIISFIYILKKKKYCDFIIDLDITYKKYFQSIINSCNDYISMFDKCDFSSLFKNIEVSNKITEIINIIIKNFFNDLNNYTIILPGGKKRENIDKNNFDIIKREIKEEICFEIDSNTMILNNDFKFEYIINKDIKPSLIVFIYDKILNHKFMDYTYILKINVDYDVIKENFRPNNEIEEIIPIDIKSICLDDNKKKNFISLLNIYRKNT